MVLPAALFRHMMSSSKPASALIASLQIITIIITYFQLSYCNENHNRRISCPETEKQALLSFKESINDTKNVLSSWNNSKPDCCLWERVVCSNSTGHVLELHLQNNEFGISSGLQGYHLNPSLLNLTQLRYLDLSWNTFKGTLLPSFIWSFAHLEYLILSGFGFRGFSGAYVHETSNGSSINLKFLDLSWNSFYGTIPSFIGSLASLEYLDLSGAGFHGIIPPSIGNLSRLHTLNLQENGELVVENLQWLRGLSRLEILNMYSVNLSRAIDWVQVVNSLPSLVELYLMDCLLKFNAPLHDANISTSLAVLGLSRNFNEIQYEYHFLDQSNSLIPQDAYVHVPRWIFQLSKLTRLDLSTNFFVGLLPNSANFTNSLQHMDLSSNYFNSTIPDWLYSCNHLEYIDLSVSSLKGSISNAIGNLTSLQMLNLGNNQLSGEIPREIARLSRLQILHLHSNELTGEIPKEIAKLCRLQSLNLAQNKLHGEISNILGGNVSSDCFGRDLETLYLSQNQLSGHLVDRLGQFSRLTNLEIRNNSLSGPIPTSLGNLTSLRALSLENNKFTGNLPESFGQLLNIEQMSLQNNMLEGVVTENHFANHTNLSSFFASGNRLTLKVNPDWVPRFKLIRLGMGSWSLDARKTVAPGWLKTQKDHLEVLDLSNTGISFRIPNWLWDIRRLNLSHNKLYGSVPDISDNVSPFRAIFVSSNQLNGLLPRVAAGVEALDLSNNSFSGGLSHVICDTTTKLTRFLLLGGNYLSEKLPDCWTKWPMLQLLNLENNNLSGNIPNSIGLLSYLRSLDLKNNRLSGVLPSSMQNCASLEKLDLSHNKFTGNIPAWMGRRATNLRILILQSNKLSGKIPSSICSLSSLRILDLSGNKLLGTIPECVNNFSAMSIKESSGKLVGYEFNETVSTSQYYLESASITTKGIEWQYDTILGLVTSIDLSRNNLSGEIPKQLTRLMELRSLNLSKNHFTGMIPDGIGDMRQLESLDLSMNFLSGEIPKRLAELSYLSSLNMSFNNLTGPIPRSTQIQSLPASSFIGNNLCGPPLTVICNNDTESAHGVPRHGNGGIEANIDWFYIFLSSGYAMGFSVVCITLLLKRSWRNAYFEFLEDMWIKFYVFMKIRFRSTN